MQGGSSRARAGVVSPLAERVRALAGIWPSFQTMNEIADAVVAQEKALDDTLIERDRLAARVEALEPYARHKLLCRRNVGPCSCGLDAARAAGGTT